MVQKQSILLVEDDRSIREVVRRYLEADNFAVFEAETFQEAADLLFSQPFDMLLLDLMLPGGDGGQLARKVRNIPELVALQGNLPMIILTSRGTELDRIAGFELGADDYVVKPFSLRELVHRVKAVLRRVSDDVEEGEPIWIRRLMLDPRGRTLMVSGENVSLTTKEFDLLWFLSRHPGQVLSRSQLLEQVWGYEFDGDDGTLTVHIHRLREKIDTDPDEPTLIQTVWGIGYKLVL